MDIRNDQDCSLSFRYSCREAVCGSCGLVINGKFDLACRTMLESLGTTLVVIEPLPNLEIQKDLIVDMEPFWRALYSVEPYLQPAGRAPRTGLPDRRPRDGEDRPVRQLHPVRAAATAPARWSRGTSGISAPPPSPSSTGSSRTRRDNEGTTSGGSASTPRPAPGDATPSSGATRFVRGTCGRRTASKGSGGRSWAPRSPGFSRDGNEAQALAVHPPAVPRRAARRLAGRPVSLFLYPVLKFVFRPTPEPDQVLLPLTEYAGMAAGEIRRFAWGTQTRRS